MEGALEIELMAGAHDGAFHSVKAGWGAPEVIERTHLRGTTREYQTYILYECCVVHPLRYGYVPEMDEQECVYE